ncbi:GPI ethanolamine phosphate transferase 2-like isoform X1 [Zingiber officinale]|uniref:GPI ethanolamine phosphate transferase 2-like isoform X1 n=3 Tax=Zingiber officinale TaxID=94328 RepID=UPI001C4DD609|nr:GPI ethanolamine phosphate transferase 2-like isoform X1 [Zingiber officinale]
MVSGLTCGKLASWTIAAVLLQILGLSFFMIGFFPVKPTLPGFSGPESYRMPTCEPVLDAQDSELSPEKLRSFYKELSKVPPSYDRLVLMVIDGLPAEFVLGRDNKPPTKTMMEAMPYTQSLLSAGKARAYHAKAEPPTVTMPRLKAMVSGAVGGFLDVAFNFNTQALLDDNLLDQFKRIGWNLVMLGDETWIKLFPKLFIRQDGVSSFFVKDTIEVDFNISRHLDAELAAEDWNLLILHYLGLDHVGHIGGRHSILMAPKLKEMDDVIMMIHTHAILHQRNNAADTLLVVVSDHGMTSSGNHGGSSYEETDSLALFIGLSIENSDSAFNVPMSASQVDVAPTLALLFGVPIPNNNIGVILRGMLDSLTDEQRLRALQLNSWQMLRLLQEHSPGLLCGNLTGIGGDIGLLTNQDVDSTNEKLGYLFSKATSSHNLWLLRRTSDVTSNSNDDLELAVSSYYEFLGNASEWLSHRATDKPINLLLSGIAIMLISCILQLNIVFKLFKEVFVIERKHFSLSKELNQVWHIDESFTLIGILIHVLSLGASSMVEEEQYTWHFLTSTLFLIFLLSVIRSSLKTPASYFMKSNKHENNHPLRKSLSNEESGPTTNDKSSRSKQLHENYQASLILLVLILGRVLRGWHQGGVNWAHLPDISKLLIQTGDFYIKAFQIITLLGLMVLGSFAFSLVRRRISLVYIVWISYFICGFLVLLHIIDSESNIIGPTYSSVNSMAQIIYICVGSVILFTVLVSPWVLPVDHEVGSVITGLKSSSQSNDMQSSSFLLGVRDCTYLIGTTFTVFWCLLQLLLQQRINDIPVLIVYLQEMASIIYFSSYRTKHRQWVEVAAMYFLGMTGHFGLGNSNSLATIDVAGAFIGISNHSTVLSGILMFIITYAAPLLAFLSMLIYISVKDMNDLLPNHPGLDTLHLMIGFPCLLPLVLNSVVLVAFTIILLLMRNHLFVWSVFSPKYLYLCASTLCVYIGVLIIAFTVVYTRSVLAVRRGVKSSLYTNSLDTKSVSDD